MSLPLLHRVPGLGGWADDPLWGAVYDWSVEHPRAGGVGWWAVLGSDLRLLHAAAAEVGILPAGSRVLDVPCGGGVALRGLRPGQGLDYVAADISPAMLERTGQAARERGVADQVSTVRADVAALPDPDGRYDLVVSFTGLHCFPDPARAVVEMVRVTRPGGVITGSAVLNDTGLRYEGLRRGGRLAGLMGPGCRGIDVRRWLVRQGCDDVTLTVSGAVGYFRGVKHGVPGRPPPSS